MARYLPDVGATNAAELEKAWRERQEPWQRQRLLVVRLVAQHELNAEQIAAAAGVARSTVFRYLDTFLTSGLAGLLAREHKGGHPPTLGAADQAGIGGRLMDRCMDTFDYDSLIERLRAALGGTNGTSAQQVLIEKTFSSERDARFVLSARYGEQAGPPLLAAMQTLFQ